MAHLDPMFWAGTRARIHAGSVERIFVEPEVIEHPREGNGYQPMLAAVLSALDDGLLEHPWHDRDDTLRYTTSKDWTCLITHDHDPTRPVNVPNGVRATLIMPQRTIELHAGEMTRTTSDA